MKFYRQNESDYIKVECGKELLHVLTDCKLRKVLRARHPFPPTPTGEGLDAGHLAVSGPALSASGPGHPPTNGTRAGLQRGSLTSSPSTPFLVVSTILHPFPFFPSLTSAHQNCEHILLLAFFQGVLLFYFSGLVLWFWVKLQGLCRRSVGRGL